MMFKNIISSLFLALCLSLLIACSEESAPQNKIFFKGEVITTFPIKSKPSDDPIKGVKIKLDSGSEINVFVEKSLDLKKGTNVTVFKYPNSAVHYLKQ